MNREQSRLQRVRRVAPKGGHEATLTERPMNCGQYSGCRGEARRGTLRNNIWCGGEEPPLGEGSGSQQEEARTLSRLAKADGYTKCYVGSFLGEKCDAYREEKKSHPG
jgi:hypothetical protein